MRATLFRRIFSTLLSANVLALAPMGDVQSPRRTSPALFSSTALAPSSLAMPAKARGFATHALAFWNELTSFIPFDAASVTLGGGVGNLGDFFKRRKTISTAFGGASSKVVPTSENAPTHDLRSLARATLDAENVDEWVALRIRLHQASEADLMAEFSQVVAAYPSSFDLGPNAAPALASWLGERRYVDKANMRLSMELGMIAHNQREFRPPPSRAAALRIQAAYLAEVFDRLRSRKQPNSPRRLRILLADDDWHDRIQNRELLGEAEISEAADGMPAFALYREAIAFGKPFDLVVTDGLMGNVSGYKLGWMIREYEQEADRTPVRIVLVSSLIEAQMLADIGINQGIHKHNRRPLTTIAEEERNRIRRNPSSERTTFGLTAAPFGNPYRALSFPSNYRLLGEKVLRALSQDRLYFGLRRGGLAWLLDKVPDLVIDPDVAAAMAVGENPRMVVGRVERGGPYVVRLESKTIHSWMLLNRFPIAGHPGEKLQERVGVAVEEALADLSDLTNGVWSIDEFTRRYRTLRFEVRDRHDVMAEIDLNGPPVVILSKRAVQNHRLLRGVLIDELRHLLTRAGDERNTRRSFAIWLDRAGIRAVRSALLSVRVDAKSLHEIFSESKRQDFQHQIEWLAQELAAWLLDLKADPALSRRDDAGDLPGSLRHSLFRILNVAREATADPLTPRSVEASVRLSRAVQVITSILDHPFFFASPVPGALRGVLDAVLDAHAQHDLTEDQAVLRLTSQVDEQGLFALIGTSLAGTAALDGYQRRHRWTFALPASRQRLSTSA